MAVVRIGLNPFDLFDACWSKGVKHLEFSPTEERTESMANRFHGCFYPKMSVTHISMALCCGLVPPICIVAFMLSFRISKFHHGCDKFEASAFLSNTHSHHIRTYQLWSLPTLPWQEYALTWNGTGALENDPQAVMASMKEPIWVCLKGCTV